MSYITYSPNEIVYIKDIGYATLINCGNRNTISQKVDFVSIKKQSIYFDPDLFNSDADSNNSKKSQAKSEQEKVENKPVEITVQKKVEQVPKAVLEGKKQEYSHNIIQAKIQKTIVLIFTSESNLKKSVNIVVKCFLVTRREQIVIEVDISKTIDTLRKLIFQQLGENIGDYYNIKLFANTPSMAELNVHSKTIIQCAIKDNAKLILTADYAFPFKAQPANNNHKYKLNINGNILTSTKIVQQAKRADEKVPIPLPPPPLPTLPLPCIQAVDVQQTKVQEKKEQQKQDKIQEKKEQIVQQKKEQKQQTKGEGKLQLEQQKGVQNVPFHIRCPVQFSSGKRYWQMKVEKVPTDEDDLVVGVCIESEQSEIKNCWNCDYLWGYQLISGKKMYCERENSSNSLEEDYQPYGYAIKQNDVVGVLLIFRGKKASVTFYKNSISCGVAYQIDMSSLNTSRKALIPFVNLCGQGQLSLDSKASPPLDSYRLR